MGFLVVKMISFNTRSLKKTITWTVNLLRDIEELNRMPQLSPIGE